jgi:hypothetical protein
MPSEDMAMLAVGVLLLAGAAAVLRSTRSRAAIRLEAETTAAFI